jgi:hypothetical protein
MQRLQTVHRDVGRQALFGLLGLLGRPAPARWIWYMVAFLNIP